MRKCYWHFPFFGGNKGKVLRLRTIWFLFRGILIFLEVIMYGLWGQRRTNDRVVKLEPRNQKESLYGCGAPFYLPLFLELLKALTALSTFQDQGKHFGMPVDFYGKIQHMLKALLLMSTCLKSASFWLDHALSLSLPFSLPLKSLWLLFLFIYL